MLELNKQILEKVSFDQILFRKELVKAIGWIRADEQFLLEAWCISSFGHIYKDVIYEEFHKNYRNQEDEPSTIGEKLHPVQLVNKY